MRTRRTELRLKRPALIIAAIFVAAGLSVTDALAAGTPAGTVIGTSATTVYTMDGSSQTQKSNLSQLVVDDRISFSLTAVDVANVTITSGGRAFMTYRLTNTGNAPHDFTLATTVSGASTLIPAAGPVVYGDAAGTLLLPGDPNAGNLPYLAGLAADTTRVVYLFITAPVLVKDGQIINYLVAAEAYRAATLGVVNPPVTSSATAAADAPVSKNSHLMTGYIVLNDGHGNGGDVDRDGRYAVTARDSYSSIVGFKAASTSVNIVKAGVVADRFGGSLPLSGATIRYTLAVTVTGAGTARAVVISDLIPVNTAYRAGTLSLNGNGLSDAADGDTGDAGGTTPGTLTVRLGDMTSASALQTIRFDVTIN